jgi:exopolysaccharide production protein ExoQ
VAIFFLVTGSAAGATLTAVGGVGVLLAMSTLHIFKLRGRLVIVLMVLVMIPPFIMARDQIVARANIFVEDVLDRDLKDLSGRAYLWRRADELIRERPVLGHGFRAIFVGDTEEGRGILRRVNQSDGRAWHFHSSYREVAVDMGFTGLAIFCFTLLFTFIALLRAVVLHPTPAYALFLSIYCVILAKTPAEVVIGTFGQTLFFGMSVWAFSKPEGNPQWQSRSYASDGTPLSRRSQRRIVHQPVRVAPPIRPR